MDATHVVDPKLRLLRITATYNACIFATMIYDWMLQWQREYQYIWRQKPSITSVLYGLIRYWTIAKFGISIWLANTAFTEDACRPWATFQVLGNVPILVFVSALLSMRLHAIYDKNKILLGALLTMTLAMGAVIIVAHNQFGPPQFTSGSGPCYATPKSDSTGLRASLWLAPFLFDIMATGLLIARIIALRAKGSSNGGLFQIMIKDQLLFFLLLAAVNLLNVIFSLGAPPNLQAINSGMSYMVSAAVVCRMVLELRNNSEQDLTFMHVKRVVNKTPRFEHDPVMQAAPAPVKKFKVRRYAEDRDDGAGELAERHPTHVQLDKVAFANTKENDGWSEDDLKGGRNSAGGNPVFIIAGSNSNVDRREP